MRKHKDYLSESGHSIVERWTEDSEEKEIKVKSLEFSENVIPIQGLSSNIGFTIILNNAKIKAEKLIIKTNRGS